MSASSAIVFLGPTLRAPEARERLRCVVRPPAAQGDVWRALRERPSALVLIDGVFESQPSVWHRELLAALAAGVPVFGASSMGALRAVELLPFGMIGVGQIFRWYRDGALVDDAEVALLHASAEHGFRPLTLPLVNVRHAAAQARAAKVLQPKEASALVRAAEAVFYQERSWARVLQDVRWTARTHGRWRAWAARGLEDLKARDARECLAAVSDFLSRSPPRPPGFQVRPSSFARRKKLLDALGPLEATLSSRDGRALAREGLRRLLLAELARSSGLAPSPAELSLQAERWLRAPAARRPSASRMDALDLRALLEARALEEKVLRHAERLFPDAPSLLEGLASELRHRGAGPHARPPQKARRRPAG